MEIMEMTPLFDRTHYHFHVDQNRPPMTPPEVTTLSQTIGGLKRSKNTLANAMRTLSRYEDKAVKTSDSGTMLNAGLKCLGSALYWLEETIGVLESARNYAKKGK